MPYSDPLQLRDHNNDWLDYYWRRRAGEVLELITPEVIAEHESNPEQLKGRHSNALHEVLNFMRYKPTIGKEYAYAIEPYQKYRIGRVVARGQQAEWVDDTIYSSEKAAVHAIFMIRLEIMRKVARGEGAWA
ncbi:MAG: hypothetical protein FWF43_05110 [Propionibacteriaceae bacterium]|nr:hypothetical protein [Propionibacteriaceae bacterium]